MSTATTTEPRTTGPGTRTGLRRYLPVLVLACVLSVAAELIGTFEFDIGVGTLTLLPLIWGLLLGAAVSLQKAKPFPAGAQQIASAALQVGVLLLATRLAFTVGENVAVLVEVGPALVLQEFGNLFTIFIAMPIAIWLGLGRAAVGATHSLCREGSFVIVGERFGSESEESRGVLAMYVFGTVFGAIWIGLLASVLAGISWFNPLALAMGSGVGSGSMMAASSNAVAAQYPEMADQILALAAVSNLLSSALGLYVGVYIALPLADRFYRFLTRGRTAQAAVQGNGPAIGHGAGARSSVAEEIREAEGGDTSSAPISAWVLLAITTAAMLLAVWTFDGAVSLDVLPGFVLLVAITVVGMVARRRLRISSLVVAMSLAMLLATPWSPVSEQVLDLVAPINFLPLTTPVLVLAGLGLGKDAPLLRRIGWRIIPVGLAVFTATFLASALIAQGVLAFG